MKRRGISVFRRKILVSQCRKSSLASLQCIGKFGVSKNFMQIRGYNVFPSKIFGLTVPKKFVGEHFGVTENFGYRKVLCFREGGYHVSPSKTFVTHTKKLRCGTLRCLRKSRVLQNFMHKKGTSPNSAEKFLSHSANINRRRTLLCFEKILVSKTFKNRRGEGSRFRRFFFISQDRKNFAM